MILITGSSKDHPPCGDSGVGDHYRAIMIILMIDLYVCIYIYIHTYMSVVVSEVKTH